MIIKRLKKILSISANAGNMIGTNQNLKSVFDKCSNSEN